MKRRTTLLLAFVLGAAVLTWVVSPAQAATWLPDVSASVESPDVQIVEDPRVVVDATGTATAVWMAVRRTTETPFFTLEVQTSSRVAGAADFGPVQTLAKGDSPAVVLHPDGAVTVAGVDGPTTWATTRVPGGGTFPAPEVVASVPGSAVGGPHLSVDGAGNAWMSWRSQDDLVDVGHVETCWTVTRDAESDTWAVPATFAQGQVVNDCLVEAATDGRVTYAWAVEVDPGGFEHEQVWTRTRSPEGELGDPNLADDTAGALGNLALTDNAAGVTALSWTRSGAPGVDLQVALRAATDATDDSFVDRAGLSGSEPVEGDVALVLDDAGTVSGGWVPDLGGVIGVTRASDGTVTTTPLTPDSQTALEIDAVVDPQGAVTLAWHLADGGFAVASSRRTAEGTFEALLTPTRDADGPADDPELGVAPSGDVTLVYGYEAEDSSSQHVRARVLDVTAPTLTATVPTTGTAGSALTMSASAADLWGPASVAWTFGDGATATGNSPRHAYAAAGTYAVRVTATDVGGNATTLTRTVSVGPAAQVGDRTPPVLSRVRLAPEMLPTGHGAELKVTSSEAGRLVGVVERRTRDGQWREVGTKRWSLAAGRSSKTFYGQAAQLRLRTGKHRVRLVASDIAGNTSSTVVLRFRVGPR